MYHANSVSAGGVTPTASPPRTGPALSRILLRVALRAEATLSAGTDTITDDDDTQTKAATQGLC